MKNLIEYDKESILSEEVFIEIFEQEDEILKARMLLSCQERAKELGVKTAFDDLVKAYRKVEKAESRKNIIKLIHWSRTSRILLVNTITWRVERGLHQIPGSLR